MVPIILLPINTDNLLLNENAYFFKQTTRLSQAAIRRIFQNALSDKNARKVYQENIKTEYYHGNQFVARYSALIFKFEKKPSFFKEPETGKNETKFGLLIILEYDEYVSIIRKQVSGISEINNYLEPVDYEVLSHFVISRESKFEKITSSNMNTGVQAIQRKTSEARDLKGIYSRFGASKQILNTLRVDNEGDKVTVSLNTSRVNSFNLKENFNNVLDWMIEVLDLVKRAYNNLPSSSFIDGFATPVDFTTIIDSIKPTYLLLRFEFLEDEIDAGQIERCYKVDENSEEAEINIIETISAFEELEPLNKVEDKLYQGETFQVRINKKSLSVLSPSLAEIWLDYGNDNRLTLQQYINSGSYFTVNFDQVNYIYSHRKIFKDSRLLGDLDNFLSTFITNSNINSITSEKGSGYNSQSTEFSNGSLFSFIETDLVKDDAKVLICDDLGTEWGDFIAINEDEICFYHAKYKNTGLSAASLQDVFGQAAKNFGNLELSNDMIDYRRVRWLENYKINGVETSIKRIRKNITNSINQDVIISEIKNQVESTSSNPNLRRKVFIVINFISKLRLEQSLQQVVQGNDFENKGVTLQILWFVNSLLSNANDLGTELRIICKP